MSSPGAPYILVYTPLIFRILKENNRQAVGMPRDEPCRNVTYGPIYEATGASPSLCTVFFS